MAYGSEEPMRIRIAGYTDITVQEFEEQYIPYLNDCIDRGDSFLLSDEAGLCEVVLTHLKHQGLPPNQITIYRSTTTSEGRPPMTGSLTEYHIETIAGGDTERYEAMFDASDGKIVWLRHDDEESFKRISGSDALDMRFTGPKEAKRVASSRSVQAAMDFYDTIA